MSAKTKRLTTGCYGDMDHSENTTSNPRIADGAQTISDIIDARLSRRGFLGGLAATSGLVMTGCATPQTVSTRATDTALPAFAFEEIQRGLDETHHVPNGYTADIVLRWGDPLFADSPAYDPFNQSEADQLKQFGYNNDYLGFVPLDDVDGEARGLLCVNHEYVSTPLMLPGVAADYPNSMTKERCLIEMAAHGGSVVEIKRTPDGWKPVVGSPYNRRITAHKTPIMRS